MIHEGLSLLGALGFGKVYESKDQDADADLKDVVQLQKLVEWTPAIYTLLVIVCVCGEELFSLDASLFSLELSLIHCISISVVCLLVSVLNAAFN